MNRMCQSSYGNLEAVINIAGFKGDSKRKLVHFYRDRSTGEWHTSAVISETPVSGGSIIQNTSKRFPEQIHGEFEVLVLELDGILKHYTRDNMSSQDDGMYIWRLSASINTDDSGTIFPSRSISYS